MEAKLVLIHSTLIPLSPSAIHLHGYIKILLVGHLYVGPGGMYSPNPGRTINMHSRKPADKSCIIIAN